MVLAVDEDSFERAQLVIFAGSANFAVTHVEEALRAGAVVVDMSGGLLGRAGARVWIPSLDALLPPSADASASSSSRARAGRVYVSPNAAATVACSLSAALADWPTCRLTVFLLQPVSERGSEGIEELEAQTLKLLSFQPIAQPVFDEQVAFNLLDRYGEASTERLSDAREMVALTVKTYLDGRAPPPALQVIQAPAFFHTPSAPTPSSICRQTWPPWMRGSRRPASICGAGRSRSHQRARRRRSNAPALACRTRPESSERYLGLGSGRQPASRRRERGRGLGTGGRPVKSDSSVTNAGVATARSFPCASPRVLLVAIFIAGCGYHVAGRGTALPSTLHTIAVPAFVNKTHSYRIEQRMTQAVIREFLSRTSYHIVSEPGSADAVLHGEITAWIPMR